MASSAHGTTEVAAHGTHETPEDWGWHHEFKHATPALGWLMTVAMLLFLIGNHEGRVEDLYLLGFAAIMIFLLIRDRIKRKNAWRA